MPASKIQGKFAPAPPKSRDLVPVGPRHVAAKHHKKRNENGHLPTTARALVLRNGKHGAMGAGELMLTRKMSGWEKLDLLGGKCSQTAIHTGSLNLRRALCATRRSDETAQDCSKASF
jgi:hypothetical protein